MNRAYATLLSIILLGILSSLATTVVESAASVNRSLLKQEKQSQNRAQFLDILDTLAQTMISDSTPFIDSPSDEIWNVVRNLSNNTHSIELKDLSSAININTIGKTYLEQKEFFNYFSSVNSVKNINDEIKVNGPLASQNELSQFIASGNENLFTIYGYWNPYVADVDTLAKLLNIRGMPESMAQQSATVLITQCRQNKIGNARLRGLLGQDEYDVAALVTTDGLINIHFAPPELLRTILNLQYAGSHLPNRNRSTDALLVARQQGNVSLAQLEKIIERKTDQQDVLKLLGCETWFWKIVIADSGLELTAILAKSAVKNSAGQSDFQVVSRVFKTISP